MEEKITFVLTSCGRIDLLKQTIHSFLRYNTYPIERYIVIEDSCTRNARMECEEFNVSLGSIIEFVFNDSKLGQTASIDTAYSMVTTPYVFHCEDDWQFYGKGFIEKSLAVMRDRPEILQTWIRPKNDGILNPIATKAFQTKDGVPFRRVMPVSFYTGRVLEDGSKETVFNYMGFSFNPGLKRMSDYNLLGSGGYHQFGQEHLIDHFYRDMGYSVTSITNNDADGYVKHIGNNRRVENTVH
jgi:hypothetical protein